MIYILMLLAGLAAGYLIETLFASFPEEEEEYISLTEKGRQYLEDQDKDDTQF